MSVATANLILTKGKLMYQDNELTPCEICNSLGKFAPNLWGKVVFFHKIPSPRLAGYFTFTESHAV